MRKATLEEISLGLDPSKYTKKPWNPYSFIKTTPRSAPIDEVESGDITRAKIFELLNGFDSAYQEELPDDSGVEYNGAKSRAFYRMFENAVLKNRALEKYRQSFDREFKPQPVEVDPEIEEMYNQPKTNPWMINAGESVS